MFSERDLTLTQEPPQACDHYYCLFMTDNGFELDDGIDRFCQSYTSATEDIVIKAGQHVTHINDMSACVFGVHGDIRNVNIAVHFERPMCINGYWYRGTWENTGFNHTCPTRHQAGIKHHMIKCSCAYHDRLSVIPRPSTPAQAPMFNHQTATALTQAAFPWVIEYLSTATDISRTQRLCYLRAWRATCRAFAHHPCVKEALWRLSFRTARTAYPQQAVFSFEQLLLRDEALLSGRPLMVYVPVTTKTFRYPYRACTFHLDNVNKSWVQRKLLGRLESLARAYEENGHGYIEGRWTFVAAVQYVRNKKRMKLADKLQLLRQIILYRHRVNIIFN